MLKSTRACRARLAVLVGLSALLFTAITSPVEVRAQAQLDVSSDELVYQFGQLLRFTLELHADTPIKSATLLFRTPDMPGTVAVELLKSPSVEVSLGHQVDLTALRLQPFSDLSWRWALEDVDGRTTTLPEKTVLYRDDRFLWHSVTRQDRTVFYTTGTGVDMAKIVLDILEATIPRVQSVVPAPAPASMRVVLYPSNSDLQEALRISGYDWVAGHTAPELGVILIALPGLTTAEAELRRTVPHELTHLMLAQATGVAYDDISPWFDEGLATYFEMEPAPWMEEQLQTAIDSNSEIPLGELCLSFPSTEEKALLAYAQSGSVVQYIQAGYGNHALTELVHAYADGLGCEATLMRVLNLSVAELETSWQEANAVRPAFQTVLRRYGWWLLLAAAGFLSVLLMVRTPSPDRSRNSPW